MEKEMIKEQPIQENKPRKINPWAWIPSLYFIETLPNMIASTLSKAFYSDMGISGGDVALYASIIYIPYFVKPLWSPFIDIFKRKRWWIVSMQMLLAIICAAIALLITSSHFVALTIGAFTLVSFVSATHDIAADGFYILALDSYTQSFFVGIRSTFSRLAMLFCSGALVAFAGVLETKLENTTLSWMIIFGICAVILLIAALYHKFILPKPASDHGEKHLNAGQIGKEFAGAFITFFKKPGIIVALFFILFYRFPEALLDMMKIQFIKDPTAVGGLGLDNVQLGVINGIYGTVGIILGGIIGGFAMSHYGLKKMLKPMALSMSVTCAGFLLLSSLGSPSMLMIKSCIFIEQFGYGFGFSAYMLYLLYFSRGESSTSHYAICTGFMALTIFLAGTCSGMIVNAIGYHNFFIFTMFCCILTIAAAFMVKVDSRFGKKDDDNKEIE